MYDNIGFPVFLQDDSLPEEAVQLRMEIEPEIGGQSPQHSLHNVHASQTAPCDAQPVMHQYGATSQIRSVAMSLAPHCKHVTDSDRRIASQRCLEQTGTAQHSSIHRRHDAMAVQATRR